MLSIIPTREFLNRKKKGYGCNISSLYRQNNNKCENKYIKKVKKQKSNKHKKLSQSDRTFLTSLGFTVLV